MASASRESPGLVSTTVTRASPPARVAWACAQRSRAEASSLAQPWAPAVSHVAQVRAVYSSASRRTAESMSHLACCADTGVAAS